MDIRAVWGEGLDEEKKDIVFGKRATVADGVRVSNERDE